MNSRKVAIIGAGAAGLANAKYFDAAGHDVTIFEIGTVVGGLWAYNNDSGRSSAYRSLHINTSKKTTAFSDFPMADDTAIFPNHWEMSEYLNAYADRFNLRERIRFRSEVVGVEPTAPGDDGRWWVQTIGGDREAFDAVVIATGHLTVPNLPEVVSGFTGRLLHSHDYKEPWEFRGSRVLVMGTGNSGLDIAADLSVVADQTLLAVRSPELVTPKFVANLPLGWVEAPFRKRWLPSDLYLIIRRIMTWLVHGNMERLGFGKPPLRTHPISHATLVNHIRYRRVLVRPGVLGVDGNTVHFSDGSAEDLDVIICATGYIMTFPFLDPSIVSADSDGSLNLFGRAVPPKWPGLYFGGYFNSNGLSNLRMFEHQAKWFAELESGSVVLPSEDEMLREIEDTKNFIKRRYPAGLRYAYELEPFPYLRFLRREQRRSAARRRLAGNSFESAGSADRLAAPR
ncbi:NAD(P)-binding domain-containing protein [Leifsonia sp. H3M29-4]|uniref:flavin-containing monooxygenase n=1 Tax=Salinibacterium metalliresistens TaxID=3031321 RepID=UPI0023DA225D|nr:NAD(P)-binding domain-containing protein [Salinibacterium metalliresistens]MDF1480370.1 NAD(P)-binding domain-containing protein [Salinibacterium metalliresistens]